eukprot:m.70553 g.70553  ORF g.70553 m.70553 type:complete len:156 (+) comp11671_c0_seq2:181-648(+)
MYNDMDAAGNVLLLYLLRIAEVFCLDETEALLSLGRRLSSTCIVFGSTPSRHVTIHEPLLGCDAFPEVLGTIFPRCAANKCSREEDDARDDVGEEKTLSELFPMLVLPFNTDSIDTFPPFSSWCNAYEFDRDTVKRDPFRDPLRDPFRDPCRLSG